jgi:hypothetical protein
MSVNVAAALVTIISETYTPNSRHGTKFEVTSVA